MKNEENNSIPRPKQMAEDLVFLSQIIEAIRRTSENLNRMAYGLETMIRRWPELPKPTEQPVTKKEK